MPWKEVSALSAHLEFSDLARPPGARVGQLARRFGISRKTAYKWLGRNRAGPPLSDRSRKPAVSPARTPANVEDLILGLRERQPTRGGRKLRAVLLQSPGAAPPSAGTITGILRRHGELAGARTGEPRDRQRFEHPARNGLWQMDSEGRSALADGRRRPPPTVPGDHSRSSSGLVPCADERAETVPKALRRIFARYGPPAKMPVDDGPPWGDRSERSDTRPTVRPRHPGIAVPRAAAACKTAACSGSATNATGCRPRSSAAGSGCTGPGPGDPIAVRFGPHRSGDLDPRSKKLVRRREPPAARRRGRMLSERDCRAATRPSAAPRPSCGPTLPLTNPRVTHVPERVSPMSPVRTR